GIDQARPRTHAARRPPDAGHRRGWRHPYVQVPELPHAGSVRLGSSDQQHHVRDAHEHVTTPSRLPPMHSHKTYARARVALLCTAPLFAPLFVARAQKAAPVFLNGMAQIVPAFQDSASWIRQELWVETNIDSDRDGKPDRVHVDVTRPGQT